LTDNWRAIALDLQEMPLDPDYGRYADLDAAGVLHISTVRGDGELVGYYANLVHPHPHYKSTLCAFLDVYWLAFDHRKPQTAIALFCFMEDRMRELGVRKMISMTKLAHDVSPLFKRLGWKPVETAYTKLI
jgi:hypothetical protein